jgi:rRNA-processing protein FCF1
VLSEASALTDLRGPELETAREILHRSRLGLTDAALSLAANQQGCSVMTNDSELYVALSEEGTPMVKSDHPRALL